MRLRFITTLILALSCLLSPFSIALATSTQTRDGITNDAVWDDPSSCGTGSSAAPAGGATGPWSYVSNAQQPYYVEQFIIDLLRDIAQMKGIPPSSTVTQEHVVGMLAWQLAEGGNTHNTGSDFNLWNMGYLTAFPQLFKGAGRSDGSQTAFASYDAGVEGNTIEMTGSIQSRIGNVLAVQGSTAEDVIHAVAYPDLTPGNEAWAWGNQSTEAAAAIYDHTVYFPSLQQDLQTARQNYAQYASTEIGPGQESTNHVPTNQLIYAGGTSNGTTSGGSTGGAPCTPKGGTNCTSGSATGDAVILCEAKKYNGIFYKSGGGHSYADFRQACPVASVAGAAATSTAGNPGPCATDCSGLVSVAVDGAFGETFSWSVGNDGMMSDGGQDWQSVPINQVQPGDIATTVGHVEIIDHYDSATSMLYTFGSHESNTQTSASAPSSGGFTKFFHYTGPTGG